jgi:hypothetical protein
MMIPVYLAVAQWALLLALGVLVVLMFRQLGRHLSVARSPAGLGPAVGSPAAGFEYVALAGAGGPGGRRGGGRADAAQSFQPGGGQASLVAFVDPTCPACEELVTALNAAATDGELAGTRPLLMVSEPPSYLQISEPFRVTGLPLGQVQADATLKAYHVSATPLLVAIDGAGIVRAAGPATGRGDIRAFVSASLLPAPDGGGMPVGSGAGTGPTPDVVTAIAGEEG